MVNEWPWPLIFMYIVDSYTHLVNHIQQLWYHRLQQFLFYLFPYKSIRDQIWPCHKIGQGQLRVIIWTNLIVLEHPMLHTNFQGHQRFGSGEEDFLRFIPYMYMGMAATLVMWPGPFEQTFISPSYGGSTWNLASISLFVSKEKKFENVESEWPCTKVNEWPWPLIFI